MGFAVYHVEKGKGAGGGLGNHIDRKEGMEHTFKHADPERQHLNITFVDLHNSAEKKSLPEAIKDRIEEGYQGKKAIRKDAVKFLSHVLTGSNEDMFKIFQDKEKKKAWMDAASDFAVKEFGLKNIVRMAIHLDEKTPHMHVVTVPLTKDGRLSAKEIVGNKSDLQARQDRYAEVMKPFGLERGIKNTGIKHENAQDYYKRIKQASNRGILDILEPVTGVFGIQKTKTIEKLENTLISLDLALGETEGKLKSEKIRSKRIAYIEKDLNNSYRVVNRKEKEISELKKIFREVIMNPEKTEKQRAVFQEQEQKRNRGFNRGR